MADQVHGQGISSCGSANTNPRQFGEMKGDRR